MKLKGMILPGNSKKNLSWAKNFWESIEDLFSELEIQNYDHWDSGEPMMDFEREVNELKVDFPKKGVLIAKSIGVALALKAINEERIKPEKCVFIGTPVIFCEANSIPLKKWIKEFKIPSLFIQNDEDPVIDADELKDYLYENEVRNFKFRDLDSESSDYKDFDEMRKELEKFLKE